MVASDENIQSAVDRVLGLEAELESAGNATTKTAELTDAKSVLRDWVDTVVAVVASPGVGRVTLIHANGNETSIASPDLPFLLSKPARF